MPMPTERDIHDESGNQVLETRTTTPDDAPFRTAAGLPASASRNELLAEMVKREKCMADQIVQLKRMNQEGKKKAVMAMMKNKGEELESPKRQKTRKKEKKKRRRKRKRTRRRGETLIRGGEKRRRNRKELHPKIRIQRTVAESRLPDQCLSTL